MNFRGVSEQLWEIDKDIQIIGNTYRHPHLLGVIKMDILHTLCLLLVGACISYCVRRIYEKWMN